MIAQMEYRWYAIQTTAGHENKVRGLLAQRIAQDTRPEDQRLIRQALVPVQEMVEIKNGKKVTVERKLYPGYVLVEMAMSQEALHVVNSIQGVIKFVGSGRLPQPLRRARAHPLQRGAGREPAVRACRLDRRRRDGALDRGAAARGEFRRCLCDGVALTPSPTLPLSGGG